MVCSFKHSCGGDGYRRTPPYCFAESAGDGVDTGGDVVETDDAEDTSTAEQPTKPTNLSATCAKTSVEWPKYAHRLYKPLNPDRITFRDLGDLGKCQCVVDCYIDQCLDSKAIFVCTKHNCASNGSCSDAISECIPLSIFQTADKALAFTLSSQSKLAKLLNSGYSLLLNQWASDGRFVYSEPIASGGILRFINHSCEPNCVFRKVRYRKEMAVVVVAERHINAMEELAVVYAGNLWVACTCGSTICSGKMQQTEGTGRTKP
ncbi:hypothetical protein PI124_g12851 [Phytophthora idaei]|nr:hypothetical protein PI125_g12746 [Phytophthora idaei]KAG3150532.1 hypothetical protein PI126_g11470 [Phytophthora idaei]KAG3242301.1 hypothetical protein PI124_g12851 [Phytophthora idaei]